MVNAKVCSFVTSGRTANDVSPTRPRVTLPIALLSTSHPKEGATVKKAHG